MKHRHRLRQTNGHDSNNHALRARLKYAAKHAPIKSVGFTMLGVATGIAIGYYIRHK